MYVIEQVAIPVVVVAASVQLLAGVKVAVLLLVKLTVPEGVIGLGVMSVMVTTQFVVAATANGLGEQVIVLVVVPIVTGVQLISGRLLESPL